VKAAQPCELRPFHARDRAKDARLLAVLLENLLGNAWKFTSKRTQAQITFGCEERDGKPTYFVQDNGAGFDMAFAAKLFGPFQRLHSLNEFEGTGIGLATVQRIIQRQGGPVRAQGSVDGGAPGLLPLDAHDRTGITFWARIGDTSANQVRFGVSDKTSRPEGGVCDATTSTGANACYDTFGVDLTGLSTHWTQYRIPFSGLGQRNFGLHEDALDASAVYTIDFNFCVNEIFDFWLDDIAFY